MAGREKEPQKARSRRSQRSRVRRMATVQPPNKSDLEEALRMGSETSASQHMPTAREPGDLERALLAMVADRQTREGDEPQSGEHALEESDSLVVPEKSGNSRVTPEDSMEGRSGTNGKPADWNAFWAQDQENALTHVAQVGAKARKDKGERFNNLLSHIKAPLLEVAYRRLRKDAAGAILYAAEKATWMAGEAIQTLGGVGYTKEFPVERFWRDAKLYEIGAGTSEIRRMLIGRELFAETV